MRDLLQADWRLRLEMFKPGANSGIDLRGLVGSRGAIIIQCKHFAQSGYRKLLSRIQKEELPKVRKLSPPRYVLATSVALSPKNKKELQKVLRPFVKHQADILGKADIENLLKLHPKIETANFKLWLTSTAVLQRDCTTPKSVKLNLRLSVSVVDCQSSSRIKPSRVRGRY